MPMMEVPPNADMTPIRFFAVVVDGEYTGVFGIPDKETMAAVLAGLDSNPTIVPVTKEQLGGIAVGWLWDGERFTAPEEA